MQRPLQITFRHMSPSEAVEADITEKMEKLEKFCGQITGCHVVVEAPHRHHNKGKLFHVLVDLTLPGKELVVARHPSEKHSHEDVYVAVRDAFDAIGRQLEDFVRKRGEPLKSRVDQMVNFGNEV